MFQAPPAGSWERTGSGQMAGKTPSSPFSSNPGGWRGSRTHQVVCRRKRKMAGRTRSSLPTDQRRRNTTIPGMAGGSAEAQRAWRSPPAKQRTTLWLAGPPRHPGPPHLARCARQHRHLSQPPQPRGFQATGNAGPSLGRTRLHPITSQNPHKRPWR